MLSRFDIFFIRQVRHWCGELTKFKFMNISISTIHDSQCYEFKSKRLHTHHRTMPQVEIFIVRNWKYIFRRVRESGKWGWGGEAPPGHVCRAEAFPLCRLGRPHPAVRLSCAARCQHQPSQPLLTYLKQNIAQLLDAAPRLPVRHVTRDHGRRDVAGRLPAAGRVGGGLQPGRGPGRGLLGRQRQPLRLLRGGAPRPADWMVSQSNQ